MVSKVLIFSKFTDYEQQKYLSSLTACLGKDFAANVVPSVRKDTLGYPMSGQYKTVYMYGGNAWDESLTENGVREDTCP